MKPGQLPQTIGTCAHCQLELYDAGPVHHHPDGTIAHIACARHETRRPAGAPG